MKQCANGHIYDEKRSSECPYCNNEGAVNVQAAFPKTTPVSGGSDNSPFPPTVPVGKNDSGVLSGGSNVEKVNKSMSATIALGQNECGINPVRGWLVAVDGDKKGISFELHGEQNSIGRGSNFDVNLSFDKAVSSDGNAVIAFDSANGKFFISPIFGKSKNNVHYNNNMLLMPAELFDYDKIQIGSFTYVFRSFCNDLFSY